ncbi:MAG: hypothetical protein Kow0067_08400 [Coriobacteriia bacterium]
MGLTGSLMPTLPYDLAVLYDDGADERVGAHRSEATHSEVEGVRKPSLTGKGACVAQQMHERPSFSHPDCDRRLRNLTGSAPFGVRGLSPPVGTLTPP